MIRQLSYIILFQIGFLGIIGICEFLYRKRKVEPEMTRRLAHMLATLSCLSFVGLFDSHWYVLVLGAFSFLLLFIGKRKGLFQSIEQVKRKTEGSYLLPISIYGAFLLADLSDNSLYFVLPLLVLGISDPLAGLAGMSITFLNRPVMIMGRSFQKTLPGSFVFLASAFTLVLLTFTLYGTDPGNRISRSLIIALVVTLAEMVSSRGLDNLAIPAATALMLALTSG